MDETETVRLKDGRRFFATQGPDNVMWMLEDFDGEWRQLEWAEAQPFVLAIVRGEFDFE